jgi:hypothetical protein
MTQSQRKSIRKLVTLTAELAERVERFQRESGAASESDALKMLIEDGLKMRDRPYDLFRRCESAVKSGQRIGEIVERLTSDHPLVQQTTVTSDGVSVYLKTERDALDERFYLSRSRRVWSWEQRRSDQFNEDDWVEIQPQDPDAPPPDPSPRYGGRGRSTRDELDDEIPF